MRGKVREASLSDAGMGYLESVGWNPRLLSRGRAATGDVVTRRWRREANSAGDPATNEPKWENEPQMDADGPW